MTRKDFQRIAETLKGTRNLYRSEKAYRAAVGEFVATLTCLCDRFNPEIFEGACGIYDDRVTTKPRRKSKVDDETGFQYRLIRY